jgi:hypothetical protein
VPLAASARQFLTDTGLPGRVYYFSFSRLADRIETLEQCVDILRSEETYVLGNYRFHLDEGEYLVIGEVGWGRPPVLDFVCLPVGEDIVYVANVPDDQLVFVNSSLRRFSESLAALADCALPGTGCDGTAADGAAAARLRNAIGRVDPSALEPGHYWPSLIDRVETGDL